MRETKNWAPKILLNFCPWHQSLLFGTLSKREIFGKIPKKSYHFYESIDTVAYRILRFHYLAKSQDTVAYHIPRFRYLVKSEDTVAVGPATVSRDFAK